MPVPTNGWNNGAWNKKRNQFYLLAEMLGLKQPSISPDDLQELYSKVASAKVFAENVQPFLEAANSLGVRDAVSQHLWVVERLEQIERELGLMQPLPFMSLRGWSDPQEFEGVAIWPAGITNWMHLRHEEILKAHMAGAQFKRVIVMWSSRELTAPADLRHPLVSVDPPLAGETFTERGLMYDIYHEHGASGIEYNAPDLPRATKEGRPLPLEAQLNYLVQSGQYDELIGDLPIYVPSTPNSLYVPLHVRRILGRDNVWFSQAGARLVKKMPDYWWPNLQDLMTIPNGIIRLWVELLRAGCITT